MEIIVNVLPVDVDGVTQYQVLDQSRPGARMYGDAPDTGPFPTIEEAEAAANAYRVFLRRVTRNDRSLSD